MTAAATDLATIRSTLNAVNAAAAAHTTALLAAGADEVSAAIVALFSAHGQEYQALSAQAAAFQDEFRGPAGVTDALVDIGLLSPSYFATTYPAVNSVAAVTEVA